VPALLITTVGSELHADTGIRYVPVLNGPRGCLHFRWTHRYLAQVLCDHEDKYANSFSSLGVLHTLVYAARLGFEESV
jgi:hypothetical protein